MAAPMAATFATDPQYPAEPNIQQEQHPNPPTRQTSFGLPSIPRTTSFGWGSKKSADSQDGRGPSPGAPSDQKGLRAPAAGDDTSGEDSFGSDLTDLSDAPPMNNFPPSAPAQQPHYSHISSQAPLSSHPPASMSNHIAGQLSPNHSSMNGYGPGPSQQAANASGGSVSYASHTSPPVPGGSQHPAMGRGSPSANHSSQVPRQDASPPMQDQASVPSVRPGGFSPGNPIHRFPPSPKWNLQESQLSEPLVSSRKTLSPQPGYYAYDKETGIESQANNVPQQPPQRIRNSGLPPVSARRYQGLFPAGASNQPYSSQSQPPQAPQQDQIQVMPAHRQAGMGAPRPPTNEFQPGDDNDIRRNSGLSKEIGGKFNGRGSTDGAAGSIRSSIRSDDISENSDVLGFEHREQGRRESFQVPHSPPALNGNQPHPQQPQHIRSVSEDHAGPGDGPPEEKKKKKFFSGAVLPGITKKQPSFNVLNSDSSSTKNNPQPGKERGKKRLSEIRGIFKNGGHDEDQPVKVSAPQAGRPSMSDPPQQQGSQAPLWHQQPGRPGQTGPGPSPLAEGGRPSMQGPPHPATGMQPDAMQPPNNGDDSSKKASGGFLGLFNNRPGSKPQAQPAPSDQQFRPGPISQPDQVPPFDMRMTGAGRLSVPPQQISPPLGPNAQGYITVPLQANQRPKVITIASGPNVPKQSNQSMRHRAPTLPGEGGVKNVPQLQKENIAPNQRGAASPPQQPSRDDGPSLPSQHNSFAQAHPNEGEVQPSKTGTNAAASKSANETSHDPSIQASPPLSRKSSHERLSIGGTSLVPRNSPARKPVGSGPSRQDRSFSASSANPPTVTTVQNAAPTSRLHHVKSDSEVTVEPVEDHPALGNQPSLTQIGEKAGFGHGRQSSINTPSVLSVAQTQSPISQKANRSSGHSQQQQLSPKPSTGFNVQAPSPASPAERSPPALPTRPQPENASGLASPPQQSPPAQNWGFQGLSRPETMQVSTSQQQIPQQMQNQRTHPGPAPELQKSTMLKFFGGSKKQQAALQPSNSSAQSKESTRDKLMGVFKRGAKVPEPNQQQQQQQLTQGQQQMPMHLMQGGRGPPGQPLPTGMQHPSMGPNGPQGSLTGPGPGPMQPGQGRGQMPPQMMQQGQAGRGQMFLPGQIPPQMLQQMQAGRGQQLPPHMMAGMLAGHGQAPLQQSAAGGRRQEPQYAQVPIPQGYQPVYGYSGATALSPHAYGQQFHGYQSPMQQQQQQFGNSPSVSPPSAQSPFAPQPQFQAGMPMGMNQGPQQQFAQAQGQPQSGPYHSQSPPPRQSMMQSPPSQGQQPGGPVQSYPDNQRRLISPDSMQDTSQQDPSSRVSSLSPQNEGGMAKPNLEHIATALNAQQQQQPNPHIQHPGSPHNYPLPDSAATFSPVNPAAGHLPNPPAPTAESVHESEPSIDRGNISDISHTPSPPGGANGPGIAMNHSISIGDDRSRSASLSPDPSRAAHHQASNPTLIINVEKANSQSSDMEDIYDATPRKAQSPHSQLHESERQSDSKNNNAAIVGAAAVGGTALGITAGTAAQDVMAQNGSYFVQQPNGGNHDSAAGDSPSAATEPSNPVPGDYPSTPYEQQQQQQSATPAEPEEKILVDQPVELSAAPDDLDDGIPVMSATSYPGQEWNPYGYGEFGDFEA